MSAWWETAESRLQRAGGGQGRTASSGGNCPPEQVPKAHPTCAVPLGTFPDHLRAPSYMLDCCILAGRQRRSYRHSLRQQSCGSGQDRLNSQTPGRGWCCGGHTGPREVSEQDSGWPVWGTHGSTRGLRSSPSYLHKSCLLPEVLLALAARKLGQICGRCISGPCSDSCLLPFEFRVFP